MVKITYTDPSDADAPKVTWHGVVFRTMVPTEVDPLLKPKLIEQARTHPYFSVEEPDQEAKPAEDPPPWKEEALPPLPKAAKR